MTEERGGAWKHLKSRGYAWMIVDARGYAKKCKSGRKKGGNCEEALQIARDSVMKHCNAFRQWKPVKTPRSALKRERKRE